MCEILTSCRTIILRFSWKTHRSSKLSSNSLQRSQNFIRIFSDARWSPSVIKIVQIDWSDFSAFLFLVLKWWSSGPRQGLRKVFSKLIRFDFKSFRLRWATARRTKPSRIWMEQRIAFSNRITIVWHWSLKAVIVSSYEPRHITRKKRHWGHWPPWRNIKSYAAFYKCLCSQIFRILQTIPNCPVVEKSFL